MKKLVLAFSLVFLASMAVATTGYDGPSDKPHIMDQPTDQSPNSTSLGNISLPDLPSQAGQQASQVLETIEGAFGSGVQNLGEALQSLLGQSS